MLCIFKTPLDPHPETPGKRVARNDAGICQTACHSQVAMCEHDPAIRHQKEGRYLLQIEGDEIVAEALDLKPQEVMISPACVKSDGASITIDDFPDNWSFGNGVTVGATVSIAGSEPCVLSWAIFPDANAAAVRAKYATLRQLMEN